MFAQFVATLASGLFAGAAIYISLVQHPAAAGLGSAAAVRFFGPMYARAAPVQACLALLGVLAGVWAWCSAGGWLWLLGAALLGFVIPFTLLAMKRTNDRLKDAALDSASSEAGDLLQRWSRLHAVRSFASAASFLTFLAALLQCQG